MAHTLLRKQPTDEGLKFSSKTVEDLKKKIFNIASSFAERETPRVLFIGESGAGKSSFISSILSTFNRVITMTSTIGARVGHEFNNSRRFFEYQIHEEDEAGRTLNLILCDSRGISKDGQLGISKQVIPLLIEGRFRHDDKIQDDTDSIDDTEIAIAEREPIEPSCIVFLEKAVQTGDVHDSIRDKLDLARDLIREKGIPSCLVITHIDEVEPDLNNVLGSKKIERLIKERAGEAGVTPNRVFVVKNYTDERRTHIKHDVLILRTILSIVSDVKQRLRDKRVQKPSSLPVTSKHVPRRQTQARVQRTPFVAANYDHNLSRIVRLKDRKMTQIEQPSVISREPSNMGLSGATQPSGAYEILRLFSQVERYLQNMSIQNSLLKNQGNASDIHYEEPIRHTQCDSSYEEEEA